jgi:hypothetical protein
MDKNVFITRFGELMVTMCEMQDVINRLSAENAKLRDEQATLGGKNEIFNLAKEGEEQASAR